MLEARGCLDCWLNTVFEGNEGDGSACILCGGCVDVCPEDCLALVPLEQIEFPAATLDHIHGNPGLFAVELDEVAADELGVVTGSAILKDETPSIPSALCPPPLPPNLITM